MDRRRFLIGSGVAIAALGGCQWASPFDQRDRLKVLGLLGAIPPRIIDQFPLSFKRKVEFKAEQLPSKIWQELQNFRDVVKEGKSDKIANVPAIVSISDGWLDQAIAQSLIQPITPELLVKMPQWQSLATQWREFVSRDSGNGLQVWGVPYRWGATAIVYRRDKLKFEINQWADLWRPELKRKITLPDDAREVIGLTLKKIGQSYQPQNLKQDPNFAMLSQELKSLNDQVLTYNSDTYLQSLLAEDTIAAVGWTSDMFRAKRLNPELKIVIPQEGTALWADIWVIPQGITTNEQAIAAAWMDFTISPAIAAQITALTDAVSTSSNLDQVPASIKADPIKFFAPEIFAKSELISPLSASAVAEYQELWTKMRSGNL
jgi:putative spermidine/putrescine transport system substrate-binding protein